MFLALLQNGYLGTRLYRIEPNVGLCGGDVLNNTGKTGHAAGSVIMTMDVSEEPLVLWHLAGTLSMIVPKVGTIDSRSMLCTYMAPYLDCIHRA
jgi:cyclophilin family peptidyl-prolyl cis-trans isomerase